MFTINLIEEFTSRNPDAVIIDKRVKEVDMREIDNNISLKSHITEIKGKKYVSLDMISPEFTIQKGEIIDTAHRMSNLISGEVGKKLKSLFDKKKYAKVDLKNIRMTSIDMDNLGSVKLEIFIPFKRVKNPCEASTSFDHSGGWDHDPEIEERKKKLLGIAVCEELEISPLIRTPENFQEYWIQWKHKEFQANCACK